MFLPRVTYRRDGETVEGRSREVCDVRNSLWYPGWPESVHADPLNAHNFLEIVI